MAFEGYMPDDFWGDRKKQGDPRYSGKEGIAQLSVGRLNNRGVAAPAPTVGKPIDLRSVDARQRLMMRMGATPGGGDREAAGMQPGAPAASGGRGFIGFNDRAARAGYDARAKAAQERLAQAKPTASVAGALGDPRAFAKANRPEAPAPTAPTAPASPVEQAPSSLELARLARQIDGRNLQLGAGDPAYAIPRGFY